MNQRLPSLAVDLAQQRDTIDLAREREPGEGSQPQDAPSAAAEAERMRNIIEALTELVVAELPIAELMYLVVTRAALLTNATGAVIELVEGDELRYAAAGGTVEPHLGVTLKIGNSLSGRAVRLREPQQSDDCEVDPYVDREAARRIGARSMLLAPLVHDQRALGVLKVVSSRPYAFDQLDVKTLTLAAGAIGAALGRQLLADKNAELLLKVSMSLDASRRHQATLTGNAERLRRIIDRSYDGFLSLDARGQVTEWNSRAELMFGWRRDEAIGQPLTHLILPLESHAIFRNLIASFSSDALAAAGRRFDISALRRDGSTIAVEVMANVAEIDGRRVFDVFLHDVSVRRAQMRSLEQRANYDKLTQLPNRYLFEDRLAHSLRASTSANTPLALMFIDIDRFKAINDQYGHEAGDRVLQETAARLLDSLRREDMVARLGGDELVVLLDAVPDVRARVDAIASKLIAAFARPLVYGDALIEIRPSIGIAISRVDSDPKALLAEADRAMYRAKQQGGGYCLAE